jgi:hypothetical protein
MDTHEQTSHSLLGWPGADIDAPVLPMKAADCVPQKIKRFFGQSGDASLGLVHLQPKPHHERFHLCHRRPGITQTTTDDEVVSAVHDVGIELFLMAVKLPRQQEASEVAVGRQRRDHSPYTKGNFEFEQVLRGWRTSYPVLDLRLKR